jgi:hypothetical protein
MLFGVQCPGRDFAFSIRKNPKNSLVALFDSETREVRRRWVVAIRYQLALLSPEVNFPPFDYGPPTGDEAATRVLMCGELQKQGHMVRNWKHRFFQLMPYEIQYFERETLKGNFMISGAVLTTDEKSLDFSLRSPTGKILVMRADNPNNKATWVRALARQIAILDEKKEEIEAGEGGAPEQAAAGDVAVVTTTADLEQEAVKAEKEEAEAADLEWERANNTQASPALEGILEIFICTYSAKHFFVTAAAPPAPAAAEDDKIEAVTAALETSEITTEEPSHATENVRPHPEIVVTDATVGAAVVTAAVIAATVIAAHEPRAEPAAAEVSNGAEDGHYPYDDGKRLHEPSLHNEYEQTLTEPVAESTASSVPHSVKEVSEADVSVEVREDREEREESPAARSQSREDAVSAEGNTEESFENQRQDSTNQESRLADDKEGQEATDSSADINRFSPRSSPRANFAPGTPGVSYYLV